jgi:adenylosuccinate synthase
VGCRWAGNSGIGQDHTLTCTVVVGAQFGSEGKGKIVALTTDTEVDPFVVRCGGPNSGHTIQVRGRAVGLRQVPAGAGNPNALLLLAAGSVVDADLLIREADELDIPSDRLVVDPRAVLTVREDKENEQESITRFGSTASGTGAALVRRIQRTRRADLVEASDVLRNRFTVASVAPLVHRHLARKGNVIIEGTQGFGLSLLHGPTFPFVTARDTTAAAFASEVGISPRDVTHIVMVLRTFPIRVGGNSGPLPNEISWEEVQRFSKAPSVFPEFTTVTKRLRRVATFDIELVKQASAYNKPTGLAVMGIDRLDFSNTAVQSFDSLTGSAKDFLRRVSDATCVPIAWIGTGFNTQDAIAVGGAPR